MKQFGLLLGLLCYSFFALGQVTVTGTVLLDGEEAIGANVLVQNTNIGTVTEFDGTFSISVDSLPITLRFTYTGYPDQVILVEENNPVKVNLISSFICDIPGYHIIITDTRLLHTANYSNLDKEDLKLNNSATVLSAMNTAPGIHIHSGALNTNRITIRGIGNRSPFATAKIRAYLDDIPLTSGVGETTIEDIDMDLLSKVTIVKGPNTSNFGSGLGGSIIMATDLDNRQNFASSSFETGSYGYYRTSNAANIATEKATFRANYNFTHHDGYRANNQYDKHNFSLLNKTDYSKNRKLTFLLNYTDLNAFIPSSLNEEDYLNEPTAAAFTWNKVKGFEDYSKLQLGASHQINWKKWDNRTSIFGTFFDSYESRPFNILTEKSTALGARTRFLYEFNTLGHSSNLNFGAEVFNEKYDWQTYKTLEGTLGEHLSDNIETRQYFNIFAETELEFYRGLTLEAGLNVNATRYELTDFFFLDSNDISGKYSFNTILSPRLGINYYSDRMGVSFFANASHGFSPPTLEETLTPDGAINTAIKPETGWNYEIGSRGDILNGALDYNVSFYYMDVKDLLVAKRLELDQFIGINAGRTSHLGFEVDLKYRQQIKQTYLSPFFNYHFAHYTFKDFVDGDNDYSENELTGNIPHKVNTGIQFDSDFGIYANVVYQFVDKMPMRDDNSIYSDSYQKMDLKLGYSAGFGKIKKSYANRWKLDVYAGVRNLWDEKYASQILINAGSFGGNAPRYYYPGLPRNYYGGLSLKYQW